MTGARVLIVEDSALIAKDLELFLGSMGYGVIGPVATGEEAVEKALSELPDLILMDITLKGRMDGIEAARRINEESSFPVVFLTGYTDHKTINRASSVGAYSFLVKPFNEGELRGSIETVLYRHKLEEKAREGRRLLNLVLRSVGDGILAVDEKLRVVFVNRSAEEMLGKSSAWCEGRPLSDVCGRCLRGGDDAAEIAAEAIRTGAETSSRSGRTLNAPDNRTLFIEQNCYPIMDGRGGSKGAVIVLRDATARREAEREAEKAYRLESLGMLAGALAHDLNNILMGIVGNLSLLKTDAGDSRPLEEMKKSADKAIELAGKLLTFSRGGSPSPRPFDMREAALKASAEALKDSAVSPDIESPDGLWSALADPVQIGYALNAVMMNAREAMPSGGKVSVRLENAEIPDISPLPLKPGRYLKITVSDTGTGIPPDAMKRLFEPYFTTKRVSKGLGLAMVRSIIESHSGHIRASSRAEGGAEFAIYLPATEASPAGETASASPRHAPAPKRPRVLLMDDEEIVRLVASRLLSECGCDSDTAECGEDAIEKYAEAFKSGAPYDAVIMDLTIKGGMGGAEAVKKLRDIDPDVRAIVSSGYSDDPVMSNLARYGFKGVLSKPYGLGELKAELKRVIES